MAVFFVCLVGLAQLHVSKVMLLVALPRFPNTSGLLPIAEAVLRIQTKRFSTVVAPSSCQ